MSDNTVIFWPEEILSWPLPEEIRISQWAEKYRVLGAHSVVKGRYLIDMVPFFGFFMDMVENPKHQVFVLCKPAQIGGTDAMLCVLGYYGHQHGSPAMIVLADQDTAEYVSNEKIKIMLESHETLERLIDRDCYTKIEMKLKNGAYYAIAWASSVAKLASRPMRIVVLDEIDKPGYNLTSNEASPLSLARERTNTFPDRKIIMTSTPTIESGNIMLELQTCDLIFDWHVPCPFCGQYQILRWSPEHCYGFEDGKFRSLDGSYRQIGRVVWEGGRKADNQQIHETVRYECGECKGLWTSGQKNEAVRHGIGVPRSEATGHERKIGMHVNRIYSLFDGGKLAELVQTWVEAFRLSSLDKVKGLQGFINSALAEPFMLGKTTRSESSILALRDDRPRGAVPAAGVLGLTCGIDTQDNGFFYTVYALGNPICHKLEAWLVREGFVETLEAIGQIISGKFKDANGADYTISMTLIDAMGHRTSEVYDWCRNKASIRPSQGAQRLAMPYQVSVIEYYPNSLRTIPGGLKLYRINTNHYKDALYGKLQIAPGDPGAFHVHAEIHEDFAAHMTSEFINDQGFWECPRGKPNHYWDCSALAFAAADILGIQHWSGQQPFQVGTSKPQQRSTVAPGADRIVGGGLRGRIINPYADR